MDVSRPRTIAYLTSYYARATDTFVRDEVAWLRGGGDTVHTYSVRKPAVTEVVNEAIAAERARTTYLLDQSRAVFVTSLLGTLIRSPRGFARAVKVTRLLSSPGIRARVWPVLYLVEACVLARDMRRRRVEHLHNHIGEGSASVALLASIISGVPFSFTVHGPSEWDKPHELSLDVKARHAKFVATISAYTQGQMRRWVDPEDWSKIHVVHCGVEVPLTDDETIEPPTLVFVSVGRLAREKGHLVLLQALKELGVLPPMRVIIVGDGPERARLESYARNNRLDGVVELPGWLSSREVNGLLRNATALIMPSFAEGLPVSIMEAYALGKPVVSSDVGAIAELVQPGLSGWLVPAGSPVGLAQALKDLIESSSTERNSMGNYGRETVRAQHDLGREMEVLSSLIAAPRPQSRRARPDK